MINELSHYITGFIRAEIKGEGCKKFLNSAVKSKISLWDYDFGENSLKVSMKSGDYKRLSQLNRNGKFEISIIKRVGLPFLLAVYKKRYGLFIGALVGLLLCFSLSSRVWVLTSSGSQIYKEEEILRIAADEGVYIGAKQKDIDTHKVSLRLLKRLEGVDFVSVNTDGVSVDIVIKDSVEKPEILEGEKGQIQNVIAKKDGVIRSIEAADGMTRVKVNEGVKKGDILITGLWDTYDKWGVKTGKSFSAAARGKVMAEVREEYSFSLKLTEVVYGKGDESCKYSLYFFGGKVPLSFPRVTDGEYEKNTEESFLYVLNTKMPISLIKETYTEKIKYTRELTEKEAENKLYATLYEEIKGKEKYGSVLLNIEINIVKEKNKVTLNAVCAFLEDIAEISPVLFEENQKDK